MLIGKNILLRKVLPALMLESVEAFMAILCTLAGLPILINPEALAPNSVVMLFPGKTVYIWALGLTIGGIVSLVGIAFSEYRIERIGILALISTVGTFSFALLPSFPRSLMSLMTYILFVLAMAARYWVLGQLIKTQQLRVKYISERQQHERDRH